MQRTDSWNKAAYPVQPSPIDKELQHIPNGDGPGRPQLPRNIKAQKDADKSSERTIVLCLDGTGDKFDSDNSNIVHIVSCLKKDDPRQVTYYQAGIGTYDSTGLSGGFSAALDMAVGSGLGLHIREAYQFLMHAYKEGDKICILGFSRGAYTARCLAGMVHKVGLLPARNIAQIPFAYEFYKDPTPEGWEQSAEFKKTFCIDVNVYFLGVFDSVASVGFIPRTLPLASTPFNRPAYFRHAMAIDERRAKFKVARYTAIDPKAIKLGKTRTAEFMKEIEKRRASDCDTDVSEVWFAGAHADVGGGAVKNVERHKLSNISLRWMIRQCFECNTGIIFKTKSLAEMGLDVQTLWPKYTKLPVPQLGPSPRTLELYKDGLAPISRRATKLKPANGKDEDDGDEESLFDLHTPEEEDEIEVRKEWVPEQAEDYFDSLCPINDQLVQAKNWWILEFWPVRYWIQNPTSGEWMNVLGMNLGRYRAAVEDEPKYHWTVQHRMNELGYKVLARTGKNVFWSAVS